MIFTKVYKSLELARGYSRPIFKTRSRQPRTPKSQRPGTPDINEVVGREMTPDARDALLTDYGLKRQSDLHITGTYTYTHTKTDKIASYASSLRDSGLCRTPAGGGFMPGAGA